MAKETRAEAWLRGPVPGVPALLMPAAHALIQARDELEAAAAPLSDDELWARPAGAASVGFHLQHAAGSLDRLFTYARGEALSAAQRDALAAEHPDTPPPARAELLARLREAVDAAIAQLCATAETALGEPRGVGRAQLPSTVIGLLFHAAEHAQRHTGQAIVTARVVRSAAVR